MAKKEEIKPLEPQQFLRLLHSTPVQEMEEMLLYHFEELDSMEDMEEGEELEVRKTASNMLGAFGARHISAVLAIIFAYRARLQDLQRHATDTQQKYMLYQQNLQAVRSMVKTYNKQQEVAKKTTDTETAKELQELMDIESSMLQTIPAGLLAEKTASGQLVLNEEKAKEELKKLAEAYNTDAQQLLQLINTMKMAAHNLGSLHLLESSKDITLAQEVLDISKEKDTAGLLIPPASIKTNATEFYEAAKTFSDSFNAQYIDIMLKADNVDKKCKDLKQTAANEEKGQ